MGRARGALVAAVIMAAGLMGCEGPHEDCQSGRLTADPGRVVQVDGESDVELVAHFGVPGKPAVGIPLEFGFYWAKAGLLVGDATTDSTGKAVYRRSFDDLTLDQRVSGALKPEYVVRWTDPHPVNGVAWCEAKTTGTLPVSQLPPAPPDAPR